MGWFLLYLFAALQVAACVIAVVARSWKLTPEPIVWRGTDVDVAANNVQQFLIDIDDSRFAYPTGMFVPDPSSDPNAGRVVMREDNFTGSRGLGWALRVFATFHEVWRRQMARDQNVVVYLVWPLWMMLAAFLAAPFLVAALLDIGYRIAFRSQITATITKHPKLDDAVDIQLGFRGLSAFGLVPDALRGMGAPTLPPGLLATHESEVGSATATGSLAAVGGRAAAWAQSAEQRFRVIYGSAIGAAVAVALLLTLFVQHGPDYGYDSTLASSESSSGYESQDGGSTSSAGTTEGSGADSSTDPTSPDEGSSTDTTSEAQDRREISALLRRYQSAYTSYDIEALRFIFSPQVTRHGLAKGGCGDASGRPAVLLQYRQQFDTHPGRYILRGLTSSAIAVNGDQAEVELRFTIVGTKSGTVSFDFTRAYGGWRVSHIDAHC
jgi:hypothetical protein